MKKSRLIKRLSIGVAICTLSICLAGCGKDDSNDDGVIKESGNAVKDVTDGVGDGINDVTDGVGDGVQDITDGVDEDMKDVIK